MDVYSGYIKDDSKLVSSASGGVATALSEKIIEHGGVVFGVAYTQDYRGAEYICAESLSDLNKMKGSKYIETKKNISLILDKLQERREVLFFGLGCDVAAVRALVKKEKIEDSKLFTVDILCHGPSSEDVLKGFVADLERKYRSRIINLSMRYKKEGWTPSYVRAEFENNKVYEELFEYTDFGYAFSTYALPRCTSCKFKGENHQGDICIGDYWGITQKMSGYNKNGVSVIIVQTLKGEELLSILDDDFIMQKADYDLALRNNPMYVKSRMQGSDYELYKALDKKESLYSALNQLTGYRVWKKSVGKIKIKRKVLNHIRK